MENRFRKSLIVLLSAFSLNVLASNPLVYNYHRSDYNAAGQNWAIAQNSKGVVYFANRNGLLEYNGLQWHLYQLPSNSQIRSLYIDDNDRVYIGAFGEFGYFESDSKGGLQYTCLSDNMEDSDLHNQQILNIEEYGGLIWFQRYNRMFIYNPVSEEIRTDPRLYTVICSVKDDMFAYIRNEGLVKFENGTETLIANSAELDGDEYISDISGYYNGNLIMLGNNHGIYRYEPDFHRIVKVSPMQKGLGQHDIPNKIQCYNDSVLFLGTTNGGIYAVSSNETERWHLNADNGLQNNTVLYIYTDRENNVWLALNNGIDLIRNEAGIDAVHTFEPNIGSVYDCATKDGYLYIGTNHGLFRVRDDTLYAETHKIPEIKDYIISIYKDEYGLIVSNPKNTYLIGNKDIGGRISAIASGMGRYVRKYNDSLLIQSTNRSLKVFRKDPLARKWVYSHKLRNYSENIDEFEIDDFGTIWVSHHHAGVERLVLDKDLMLVERIQRFDGWDMPAGKIYVFKISHQIVFSDGENCWTYNRESDKIIPFDYFNKYLGTLKKIKFACHVKESQYWIMTGQAAALVDIRPGKPEILKIIPFKSNRMESLEGYECIVPVNEDYSYICVENGLIKVSNKAAERQSVISNIIIDCIYSTDDYGNRTEYEIDMPVVLRPDQHSVTFSFGLPSFVNPGAISFECQLEGLDFNPRTVTGASVTYDRLASGHYNFILTAKDAGNTVIDCKEIGLTIKPQWYNTSVARILYVLAFIGCIAAGMLMAKRIHRKKKEKLLEAHEKEILKMENARLADQIRYKSQELASSALQVAQKNELLSTLKGELLKHKNENGMLSEKDLKAFIRYIDSNMDTNINWEMFRTNFDLIHEGYFRTLLKRFPQLSSNDLKVCALLRLNLSTKEIASFLNISPRGAEISRYRLRKKLGLENEDNLVGFLVNIK